MPTRSASKVNRLLTCTGERLCDKEGCPGFGNNFVQPNVNLRDPDWISTPGYYYCDEHAR